MASSRENAYVMELEDPRVFTNQMMMSSSNTEDKLGSLKAHLQLNSRLSDIKSLKSSCASKTKTMIWRGYRAISWGLLESFKASEERVKNLTSLAQFC